MPTLVHLLPTRIDRNNLDEFQDILCTLLERHGALILDCSQLEYINVAGMRVLESAARSGTVTLVRATPIVHLLASVFSIDVDDGIAREGSSSAVGALPPMTTGGESEHPVQTADDQLLSELRELAMTRGELSGVAVASGGLSQFEVARLARVESRIETVVGALRSRRPVRDWLPDLR